MKRTVLTVVIPILIIIVALAYLKFVRNGGFKVKTGEFIGMEYFPGFSDMMCGTHGATLKKNESGEWMIESRSRESHADPILLVTYSVDEEKLAEFVLSSRMRMSQTCRRERTAMKLSMTTDPGL